MIRPPLPQGSAGLQNPLGQTHPAHLLRDYPTQWTHWRQKLWKKLEPAIQPHLNPDSKIHTHATGQGRNRKTCCTYWLLPVRRCGSRPLPGSCGRHRRRSLRPVCSAVRGRCVRRRASRWAAACAETGRCPCPSPLALHPCTTPLLGLDDPLPYSWEWQAPLWKLSGQRGAPQSGVGCPLGADEILRRKWQRRRFTTAIIYPGFIDLNGNPYVTVSIRYRTQGPCCLAQEESFKYNNTDVISNWWWTSFKYLTLTILPDGEYSCVAAGYWASIHFCPYLCPCS